MRVLAAAASAAVVLLVVGTSQPSDAVSLLSISGTNDFVVPANNDLVRTPNPAFQALVPLGGVIADADDSGLFWSQGVQLSTTADNVMMSFNYIGSFAGATNTFTTEGGSFGTPGLIEAAGGDYTAQAGFSRVQPLAGLVDFSFSTSLGGSSVYNWSGNSPTGVGDIHFLAAYLELQQDEDGGVIWEITDTPTNVVLLLLDDSGAGPDLDYDDLGVIVVATPIPAA